MFVKSIKIVSSALFPIFRVDQITLNEIRVSVGGTGFFINSEGYFVSVAHIFHNTTLQTKYYYWGKLPEEVINPKILIEEIVRDDEHDIFVGKVGITTNQYLHLYNDISDIGRSVCISGYPLANITPNNQGGLELGGVRKYFQPSFVLDKAVVNMGRIAESNVIHDGFLVRDFGLFGMSGGPVFDIDGVVLGMQASVTAPRISEGSDGRKISVENAMVIRSNLILDFLARNNILINQ